MLQKTAEFVADVERQYEWYALNAGWEVADRYLDAIEATCALIGTHPRLGPEVNFPHPRLNGWRFFVVMRPFHRHVVFFEIRDDAVQLRRAMHGHRDLPKRLPEPPGAI